jgi:hypothetical protein
MRNMVLSTLWTVAAGATTALTFGAATQWTFPTPQSGMGGLATALVARDRAAVLVILDEDRADDRERGSCQLF